MAVTAVDASAQAPAASFANLGPLVTTGQQVVVRDADGRKFIGEVVSLTGNQLEVERRRWFRRERRLFTEESTRRIEHRDSTANGVLIGAGVGALAALVACKTNRDPDNWSCLGWLSAPVPAALIGGAMDGARNRPLYISPSTARLTVMPLLRVGRDRATLAAAIRF